jgi:arsenate reductase
VTVEIWINPACSKCRTATAELDAAGLEYTVRRYLDEPPTRAELADVLDRMGLQPWDIARPAEAVAAGITLPREAAHRDDWIAEMVAEPRVIQRPIITTSDGFTAVVRDRATLGEIVDRERS